MPTILTCTDGSPYAPSIYRLAAWAAARTGAEIHVLHAIEHHETPATGDLSGNLGFSANDELLEELTRLDETRYRVARLRGKAILGDAAKRFAPAAVTTTQRHGSLVDAMADFEGESDLIVLGKRGEHADFSKGHLGSNLERVVRSVKIPVLVAAREFRPVESFTVAFDGGQSALKAIHYLATQPLLKDAECDLIAVGKADSELARSLDVAAATLRAAGYTVASRLVPGDPEEVISARVRESGSDLLVMGAYGHSRIRELILGSTTAGLIRTCHVPVLLFR
ncbi:universal stress protein [Akkermansiaceae bacterium]|nr:universal stress protein [Akkermansiaceae bacterium]